MSDATGDTSYTAEDANEESQLSVKLNPRLEISLRKERERQVEASQFTFKPNVTPYKKSHVQNDTTAKENRFDKLYGDALKRHLTVQSKDEEDKKDKDLTFTPKISSLGAKVSRSSSRDRLGLTSRSNNNSRASSRERDSDRRSRSKAVEEYQNECTFTPTISKRAKSIERQRSTEIAERLYHHDKVLKDKMEQKKHEKDNQEMAACTFQPSVTSKARLGSSVDVTERLNRFNEMKKKKLEEAIRRKEEEESEQLTFKPKLTKRAQSPLGQSTDSLRTDRMSPSPAKKSSVVDEAFRELTFQPKLFTKRSPSPRASKDFGSVHEKLFSEGVVRRREQDYEWEQKRAELERREATFTPELVATLKVREGRDENLFERLNSEKREDEEKMHRLRKELDSEFTFRPQLTEKSVQMANNKTNDAPMYDRLVAEQQRTRMEMEMRQREKEEQALKEATFKPTLPESSKELARRRSMSSSSDLMSLSVHSRLNTMNTVSSANVTGLNSVFDNVTVLTEDTGGEILSRRNSVVIPEKDMQDLVRRLSMHKIVEEPKSEVKTKVLAPKDYEEVIERLALHKTMSFTLKTDPNEYEAIQPKLLKEHPKVSTEVMQEIVERLQVPTISAAVALDTPRSASNSPLARRSSMSGSMVMSSSQLNLLLNTSTSPRRRHTLASSPPKSSFFGTPLEKIPSSNAMLNDDVEDEDVEDVKTMDVTEPLLFSVDPKPQNDPEASSTHETKETIAPFSNSGDVIQSPKTSGKESSRRTSSTSPSVASSRLPKAARRSSAPTASSSVVGSSSKSQSTSKATASRPTDDFERKLQETLAMIKPIESIGVGYSVSAEKDDELLSKKIPKPDKIDVSPLEPPVCVTVDSEDTSGVSEIKSEDIHTSRRNQSIQPSPTHSDTSPKAKTVVGRLPPSGKKTTPKSADKRTATPNSKPTASRPSQKKTGEKSTGASASVPFSKEAEEFINSIPQVEVVNDDNSVSSEW